MLFKRAALATTAASIIGGSFWMSSDETQQPDDTAMVQEIAAGGSMAMPEGVSPAAQAALLGQKSADATLVGPKVASPGELFHFQVTKDWIVSRWSYVTTLPKDQELYGYRVPVVTGTKPEDISGALTYYFDEKDQVQRIVFSGVTAEPRPLVWQLSQQFGLKKQEGSPVGVSKYQAQWSGEAVSELTLRSAGAMLADTSQPRYQVELQLSRPPKSVFFPEPQRARGRPLKI